MMLPVILDPWAAHAMFEAAHLAAQFSGRKVWLVSVAPPSTLAANAVRYLSVTPPKQQRHTRIVKDQTPDQIAGRTPPLDRAGVNMSQTASR